MTSPSNQSDNLFVISIPEILHQKLVELADKQKISVDQIVQQVLENLVPKSNG